MYLWRCRRPRIRLGVRGEGRYVAEVHLSLRAEEDLAHERLYCGTTRCGQQNIHGEAVQSSLSSVVAVAVIWWMAYMNSDILARAEPVEDDLGPAVRHADRTFGVGLTASSAFNQVLRGDKYTYPPVLLSFVPEYCPLHRERWSIINVLIEG